MLLRFSCAHKGERHGVNHTIITAGSVSVESVLSMSKAYAVVSVVAKGLGTVSAMWGTGQLVRVHALKGRARAILALCSRGFVLSLACVH